jgi:hypothetical protein
LLALLGAAATQHAALGGRGDRSLAAVSPRMCTGLAASTALLTASAAVTMSSIERCARAAPPLPTSRHKRSIRRTAQDRLIIMVMMVVVVVVVMMVMVMIVAVVVVVVMMMMVVLGKFEVGTLGLRIGQTRRGLSGVRGHQ